MDWGYEMKVEDVGLDWTGLGLDWDWDWIGDMGCGLEMGDI